MRFRKSWLVIMAVAMMTLPTTTGTAYAAETVLHVRTQFLSANPNNGMSPAFAERQIWLRGGVYGWWHHVAPPATVPPPHGRCTNYTGPISEGTYTWTNQLWPAPPETGPGWYRHDSYLSGGGVSYKISCTFRIPADGNYTWGSGLDPHF